MQRSRRLHEVCGRALLSGASPSDFAAEDYHPGRRATRPTSTLPGASNSACKPGNGRDNPRALRCSHSQLLNVIRSQTGSTARSMLLCLSTLEAWPVLCMPGLCERAGAAL